MSAYNRRVIPLVRTASYGAAISLCFGLSLIFSFHAGCWLAPASIHGAFAFIADSGFELGRNNVKRSDINGG